jgi:methylmalonyl-CoA mutase cobalamin-binding subunit
MSRCVYLIESTKGLGEGMMEMLVQEQGVVAKHDARQTPKRSWSRNGGARVVVTRCGCVSQSINLVERAIQTDTDML